MNPNVALGLLVDPHVAAAAFRLNRPGDVFGADVAGAGVRVQVAREIAQTQVAGSALQIGSATRAVDRHVTRARVCRHLGFGGNGDVVVDGDIAEADVVDLDV